LACAALRNDGFPEAFYSRKQMPANHEVRHMPYLFWMVLPFAMWNALTSAPAKRDEHAS